MFLQSRFVNTMILAGLLGIGLFIHQAILFQNWWRTDTIAIWIFDVGQGDAIFIDADVQILMDGGPDQTILEPLAYALPFWDRSIDILVNTHPHADHLTGLIAVLDRYIVGEVWTSGQEYSSIFAHEFSTSAHAYHRNVEKSDWFHLAPNARAKILWPTSSLQGKHLEDPNQGSIVLLLECADTRMLFTGDITQQEEYIIAQEIGDIDILKVAHQGSKTSTSDTFLRMVKPEVAIISVGENQYGHPHTQVLDRLTQFGIQIFRTDKQGSVRVLCGEYGYVIDRMNDW